MNLPWNFGIHRVLARLHGGGAGDHALTAPSNPERSEEFKSAYAEYATATAQANAMLQTYGRESKEFSSADVSSMRLFHRVKKMQGLSKPRSGQRG